MNPIQLTCGALAGLATGFIPYMLAKSRGRDAQFLACIFVNALLGAFGGLILAVPVTCLECSALFLLSGERTKGFVLLGIGLFLMLIAIAIMILAAIGLAAQAAGN